MIINKVISQEILQSYISQLCIEDLHWKDMEVCFKPG